MYSNSNTLGFCKINSPDRFLIEVIVNLVTLNTDFVFIIFSVYVTFKLNFFCLVANS